MAERRYRFRPGRNYRHRVRVGDTLVYNAPALRRVYAPKADFALLPARVDDIDGVTIDDPYDAA